MGKHLDKQRKKLQHRREAWATLPRDSHYTSLDSKQSATKRPGSMNRKKQR